MDAAEIVMHVGNTNRGNVVYDLLRKRICKAGKRRICILMVKF
jgi:hypothetical protein